MRYLPITLLILIACKKPEILPQQRPGYIKINEGTLIEEGQVFKNHVKTVWMYIYPEYFGTFNLPKKVPIPKKGLQKIFFQGAVAKNGGYLTPIQYPFWRFDSIETKITADTIIEYTPTFKYYHDTLLNFPFYESFEDQIVDFEVYSLRADTIPILPVDSIPYIGTRCAIVKFDSSHRIFEVKSANSFTLPRTEQVWMEIAIRGNQLLQAGLIEEKRGGTQIVYNYITLVPKETEWTKVYIDLTPIVASTPSTSKFRLYLFSDSYNNPQRYFMLDDIKLIHFRTD